MKEYHNNGNIASQSGKVIAGLFIIAIGALLLVDNIWQGIPDWIFKWHTFLIALGLFIGVKHNFRNSGWFVITLIGIIFTVNRAIPELEMKQVLFPVGLLIFGAYLILKPKSTFTHKAKWKDFKESEAFTSYTEADATATTEKKKTNSNDYLDSVNVFGGSHQNIYSKNFKGGEITAVFGGCDLNLTQADFEGEIEIDITAIFGGAKIIIPPGWEVKSEVTAIFGGIDDKRSIQPVNEENRKLVIIKGIALFGGIDIRNY
ncbi:MAG TPA: LiaF domain-containing protein [Pedobacter sp.]|nr:LiaF domain-containing protein [Pedobacter sp.]